MSTYSTPEEVEDAYNTLQKTFRSGKTKEIAWRKWQLKQLWWLIEDNEERIAQALREDLNRHAFESAFGEFMPMKRDLLEHIKNVEKWTADQVPDSGFVMRSLLRPTIRYEPLGVALIIGPWNFPILLLLQPLMAAIAAGCTVVLKPSEITLASQALLVDLIPKYLDTSAIRVVTGGAAETGQLLERKFDHVFFTGSVNVARHIAAAAAKHLTPTVLELGGQCPAIITKSADLESAAKNIAWIKFMNSGQVCLSVNHVFAHPDVQKQLIERMAFYFNEFSKDSVEGMTRIVNQKNFDRLKDLFDNSKGTVEHGGDLDPSLRRIPLSLVSNVTMKDTLMSEELFGSICPVVTASTQEAIDSINDLPHPLGLYVFSNDTKEVEHVISSTNSGGVTVNGCAIHATVPNAPFGGVGDSGHGYYHGEHGFKSFSYMRTIARPTSLLGKMSSFLMPPYSNSKVKSIAVKNNLGFKRGSSLEDERRLAKRAKLFKQISRSFKVVALLVAIGVVDYQTDRRLGFLRRVQDLTDYLKTFLF